MEGIKTSKVITAQFLGCNNFLFYYL